MEKTGRRPGREIHGRVWGIFCLLFLLVGGSRAYSYSLNGAYWSGTWPVVPYYINAASFPSSVGTQQQVINAITKGINHWNFEAGTPVTLVYMGTTTVATRSADGINVIYYEMGNCSSPQGACIGQTNWWPATGALTDFDISFNEKNSSGSPVNWDAVDPIFFTTDLWGYAAHEVGHALGLAHSQYTTATMTDTVGSGSTILRFLTSDDIAGALDIYGNHVEIQASATSVSAGTNVTLTLDFDDSAGLTYQFLASQDGVSPGYAMSQTDPNDYRVLSLNEPWIPMEDEPSHFINYTGTVSAGGNASMTWNTTRMTGVCLHFVAVVYESAHAWPNDTRHISDPIQVCVTQSCSSQPHAETIKTTDYVEDVYQLKALQGFQIDVSEANDSCH